MSDGTVTLRGKVDVTPSPFNDDETALLVLMPVLAPVVPLVLRLTTRGVTFVAMAPEQLHTYRRRRSLLGWATAALGTGLAVLGIVLYRTAN